MNKGEIIVTVVCGLLCAGMIYDEWFRWRHK